MNGRREPFTFDALNPPGSTQVYIREKRLLALAKLDKWKLLEARNIVPQVLEAPLVIFELLRWKKRDRLRCEERKSSFFGVSHEAPPVSESTHRGGGWRSIFCRQRSRISLHQHAFTRKYERHTEASQRLGLARHLSCKCSKGHRGSSLPWGRNLGRSFFRMKRERGLVALGMNSLSIHVLRPYPGWDDFRKRIVTALQAFEKVSAPKGIRTNRVAIY